MRLKYRILLFIYTQLDNLKSIINCLGSMIFPSWHYINHHSICTTGKVLKINSIYTFKEEGYVDIVRLLDVYKDKRYLYCTLYFFSSNKITTVSQVLESETKVIWQIMNNRNYDEIMSQKLWQEVDKENELLEFDF